MSQAIDMAVLRKVLAGTENMVEFYNGEGEKKRLQNEALAAAGLKPLHDDWLLSHSAKMAAEKRTEVACLTAVIAFLEGESVQAEAA